jgi:hypothetical protein
VVPDSIASRINCKGQIAFQNCSRQGDTCHMNRSVGIVPSWVNPAGGVETKTISCTPVIPASDNHRTLVKSGHKSWGGGGIQHSTSSMKHATTRQPNACRASLRLQGTTSRSWTMHLCFPITDRLWLSFFPKGGGVYVRTILELVTRVQWHDSIARGISIVLLGIKRRVRLSSVCDTLFFF